MTPEKVYHLDLDSNRGPLWPAGRGRVCIFRAENRRCITASTDLALKPYQTNDLCEMGLCGPVGHSIILNNVLVLAVVLNIQGVSRLVCQL